jgi:hypothetical protein
VNQVEIRRKPGGNQISVWAASGTSRIICADVGAVLLARTSPGVNQGLIM